jgi:Uma2 family endonuclease
MIAVPKMLSATMAAQDYLVWESQQNLRYELIAGQVVAMTGGTIPHNDLAVNLLMLLQPQARAKGCRANIADVKVMVATTGNYFYPDLVVSCDPGDRDAVQFLQNPVLIVEVLSPSTAAKDRDIKLKNYRLLPSLQEYVLISATEVWVECYRRCRDFWIYQTYGPGTTVKFESVGLEWAIEAVYDGVNLTTE